MADIDIDPFKEHDETDNYADEPAAKSFLLLCSPQEEDLLGNQNANKILRDHVEALY